MNSTPHERTTTNLEESGWTIYFEDFFGSNNNNDDDEDSSFSYDDGTSAVVSDAASLVANKSTDEGQVGLLSMDRIYSRLGFKKRGASGAMVDDSLEDTASSPVNSPKVRDGVMCQIKSGKQQQKNISQDKGNAPNQQVEEKTKLVYTERENDNSELKKKGLCGSTVFNYLG